MMKMNEREQALYKVQITGFAVYDTNLYLDTHPCDTEALSAMREYQQAYREARDHYEKKYGPLTASASCGDEYWAWINSPWPWSMEG